MAGGTFRTPVIKMQFFAALGTFCHKNTSNHTNTYTYFNIFYQIKNDKATLFLLNIDI